jgi:hypothetical protein
LQFEEGTSLDYELAQSFRILHNKANKLGEWVIKTEALLEKGKPRWTEHPKEGKNIDVVALPLPTWLMSSCILTIWPPVLI